tara:strand:- start:17 stop:880 length:864 start_codon:yes stop_codon:yes gene_type:complete
MGRMPLASIDQTSVLCHLANRTGAWPERPLCENRLCYDHALGKMLFQLSRQAIGHGRSSTPTTYAHELNHWTKHSRCRRGESFWTCLLGESRWSGREGRGCDRVHATPSTLDLQAGLLFLWIGQGKSLNPAAGRVCSVHIRQGDSCDVKVATERPKTGRVWGSPGGRRCVHEDVYVKLVQNMTCDTILVASDSTRAVQRIDGAFRGRVRYNAFTRAGYTHGKGWIENRKDLASDYLIRMSLLDMRLLLDGDTFLMSKCSYYSKVAWMAASFRRGRWLPYHSVDECAR